MSKPALVIENQPAIVLCSFCGCSQHQVAQIVRERDGVAICDNCVAICVQVMVDARRAERNLPVLSGRR